jgi:hypothetical protein
VVKTAFRPTALVISSTNRGMPSVRSMISCRMLAGRPFSPLPGGMLRDGLNDAFSDAASGWHTEDLVKTYQRSQGDLPPSQCLAGWTI